MPHEYYRTEDKALYRIYGRKPYFYLKFKAFQKREEFLGEFKTLAHARWAYKQHDKKRNSP